MLAQALSTARFATCDEFSTTDFRLVAALAEQRLRAARFAAMRRVSCSYADGVLTLSGVVATYHLKQLAQTIVRGIDEVSRVENCLRVCSSATD